VTAGLVNPKFTIRRFLAARESDNPVFVAQYGRVAEGLRMAGAPKRLHVLFDDDGFLATLCDECLDGYDTPPLDRRTSSSAPLLPEYPRQGWRYTGQ
jgi:hypothetical protein